MSEFEISLLCSSVISYYQVQNGISPVKRLYVRNASDFDCENIEISVSSKPDFLLPVSEIQAVFPARANLRSTASRNCRPFIWWRKTESTTAK